MATTAQLTEQYLGEHPSIKDCLKNRVINYSKLARKIGQELGIEKKTSMEAILVACRRYAAKLKTEKAVEDKIRSILKQSELEIKNKIIALIINRTMYTESLLELEKKVRRQSGVFYAIEGTHTLTILTSEKYLDDLKNMFGKDILKVSKGLVMVMLKSPEDLESTPGVIAYLYSAFAEHGINIAETMSCWTDTIFVISEQDIPVVMKLLKF